MATEVKRSRSSSYAAEIKTKQLLTTYSSTVFACDISGDTRYVKCDFPQCSEHSSSPKPPWILNTLRNVKTLEVHVGDEIDTFMKSQRLDTGLLVNEDHIKKSADILDTRTLPQGARKVLAVFNIQDPQSLLGEWINLFLTAAEAIEGEPSNNVVVLTQSFVSRKALMECIARLEFLKDYSSKVDVVCVLSSHSSSQGQVFSCTPTSVSKQFGFEEFCSLHDFSMACQDVLGSSLTALHISSCFTLKLDCSHAEWPVDISWLKSKLSCVLTGSSKEVYETGSQVCDLYLLLSTMLPPIPVGSCGKQLLYAVDQACTVDFPDLAREMGLQVIDSDYVDAKLMTEGTDDQVTPPGLVISAVHVVLLIGQTNPPSDAHTTPIALAQAIAANLDIRKASDVRCDYITLPITIDKVSSLRTKSSLREKLDELPQGSMKFLFIALDSLLANPSTGLVDVVRTWSASRGGDKVYGVHFQNINSLQAYYIKNRLTEVALHDGRDYDNDRIKPEHIPTTGMVGNGDRRPHFSLPVLLYMIHLAIGENGNRLAGQGIPSAVYSKKPVGCGKSSWTLEEVYMETSFVLSGLARKCSLQLLSSPVDSQTRNTAPVFKPTSGSIQSDAGPSKPGNNGNNMPKSNRSLGSQGNRTTGTGKSTSETTADNMTRQITSDSDSSALNDKTKRPAIYSESDVDRTFFSSGVLSRSTRTSQASAFAANEAIADSSNVSENYANLALKIMQDRVGSQAHSSSATPTKGQVAIEGDGESDSDDGSSEMVIDAVHPLIISVKSLADVITDEKPDDDLDQDFDSYPPAVARKSLGESSSAAKTSESEASRNPVALAGASSKKKPSHSRKKKTSNASHSRDDKAGNTTGADLNAEISDDDVDICCDWDKNSKGTQANFPPVQTPFVRFPNSVNEATKNACHGRACSSHSSDIVPSLVDAKGSNELQEHVQDASIRQNSKSSKVIKPESNLHINIPLVPSISKTKTETNLLAVKRKCRKTGKTSRTGFGKDNKESKAITNPNYNGDNKTKIPKDVASARPRAHSGKDNKYSQEVTRHYADSKTETPNTDRKTKTAVSDRKTRTPKDVASARPLCDALDPGEGSPGISSEWDKSDDLPLMANVDQVLVKHYILDLAVNFDDKVMHGSIVLFLDPASDEVTRNSFQLCLDSTLVSLESVDEVFLPNDFEIPFYGAGTAGESPSDDDVYIECVKQRHKVPDAVIDLTDGSEERVSSSQEQEENDSKTASLFQRIRDSCETNEVRTENVTTECTESSQSSESSQQVSSTESSRSSLLCRLRQLVNKSITSGGSKTPLSAADVSSTGNASTKDDSSVLGDVSKGASRCKRAADQADTGTPKKKTKPSRSSGFLGFLENHARGPLLFKGLMYSVHGWCIRIWKEGAVGKAWPRCVWIKYHTSPEGQSLSWTTDQDGRPCVFSPGAYINNRSLMPCQEPPVAMATWQAAIHVSKGCMAVMSGNPVAMETSAASQDDQATFFFEMDTPLPSSTLALAVGWFESMEGRDAMCQTQDGTKQPVPCRMIAVPSVIDRASDELLSYVPRFLEASCELLGPYPFKRLDLLILPRSFACMGLKNPNLVFLSQSLLAGDGSMRLRVAHEISHAWFGLLIGAKDWTEEWLSEGFATYVEERIQAKAEQWSSELDSSMRELRQLLRYRTLSAEMNETDENLQCLRLKSAKPSSALSAAEAVQRSTLSPGGETKPFAVVKNGQICSKKWTQVHYLKGYFLLHHMANMVGVDAFERFLHDYVTFYNGQLVTSEDFFEFFLNTFPNLSKTVKDEFMCEWLECPGMPKCLRKKKFSEKENNLIAGAVKQYGYWRNHDTGNRRNKQMYVKRRKQLDVEPLEHSEQIVLMLEKLLERDTIMHTTLRQLNRCYDFKTRNAEIRHRWCELVVKQKLTAFLIDVKQFLTEDQGMGIYLFGELIISGQPRQRMLAEEVFAEIRSEMDRCTYQTVSDMLQGSTSSE